MLENIQKDKQPSATLVIDTILGFEDNQKKETKLMKSQRIMEARRAIEKHQENKALIADLDEYYTFD
jgi:hypothetical protein